MINIINLRILDPPYNASINIYIIFFLIWINLSRFFYFLVNVINLRIVDPLDEGLSNIIVRQNST